MPKQVDHAARRLQIAEAVCRLAGKQGLEAVSLRHVALEAGVSMGLIQHYFTTKDQMLVFAFQVMSERVEHRIGEAVGAGAQPQTTRSLLRALLVELLPLGEHSRVEAPMWIAFLARAVVEPRLANPLREGSKALRHFIAEQIRLAHQAGKTRAGLDPEREAAALLALIDGLMVHSLIDGDSASAALATLDYQLDRIFTPDQDGSPQPGP